MKEPTDFPSAQVYIDHVLPGQKIEISHVYPPIPTRQFDYMAVLNNYDCDCDQDGYFSRDPVGYGPTAEDAADELAQRVYEDLPDEYEPPLPKKLQAEIDRDMAQAVAQVKVWDHFLDKLMGTK